MSVFPRDELISPISAFFIPGTTAATENVTGPVSKLHPSPVCAYFPVIEREGFMPVGRRISEAADDGSSRLIVFHAASPCPNLRLKSPTYSLAFLPGSSKAAEKDRASSLPVQVPAPAADSSNVSPFEMQECSP